MEASIITTYRCNARCHMCNVWMHPTSEREEITPADIAKLPQLKFANITGGEPFLREDIEEIIDVVRKKADRVVISTNGFYTDRVIDIAKKRQDIGIRISIEGLPKANDELRGMKDGFDSGLRTLLELHRLGFKDIGFGITVSDKNAKDLMELFQLAKAMNLEFATAVLHNSYYFHKEDNEIKDKETMVAEFEKLICELLKTKRVKNWFRAYFNHGLINYINGKPRLLPCEMGNVSFFLDPFGEIRPCNGMQEKHWLASMGNIKQKSFEEIWNSPDAARVRELVKNCPKNCWMIGSAAPVMKKYIFTPLKWIAARKLGI